EDTLSYDPFLFGDADALTKKIIYSGEFHNEYYRAFQETWLQSFFRVIKTEPLLDGRIMLRHLHRFLVRPMALQEELKPLCRNESNVQRLDWLSAVKTDSLSGIAAHVGQLVEDESLSRIFDNPEGRYLNIKEVIRKGGNIFIEVPILSKEPQAKALGRMILMEMQLLSEERQAGKESSEMPVMIFLDEFGNFCWPAFTKYLSLCRSSRQGMVLAHQSIGNLESDRLPRNFKKEIVDNTKTKFFLGVEDESALWAAEQFGQQKIIRETITMGQNIDRTDTGAKESTSRSYREDLENYLTPIQLNLLPGYGFAKVLIGQDKQVSGPVRVGYIDEKDLCSDAELMAFIKEAALVHGRRPRNGSLIDNGIDPGPTPSSMNPPPLFMEPALDDKSKVLDEGLFQRFRAQPSAPGSESAAVLSGNAHVSNEELEDPTTKEETAMETRSDGLRVAPQKEKPEEIELDNHIRIAQVLDAAEVNTHLDQFVNNDDDND
ncbi:MAG: TraM recognition domain-containing protein, partial [Fibrobacterota bacterium]|nr:TraM recognition domain-containing protein [Fibrobacterota bacterium]